MNESNNLSAQVLVVPLLHGLRMSAVSAVRAAIQWVLSLESSPHIGGDLLRERPDLLHLLFFHTASACVSVADLAKEALEQFLERAVSDLSADRSPFPYSPVIDVLFSQCRSSQPVRWSLALDWITAITRLRGRELVPEHGADIAAEVELCAVFRTNSYAPSPHPHTSSTTHPAPSRPSAPWRFCR